MTENNGQSPLQKDCVCLQLHVRMPGVRAKADISKIDAGSTDKDMLSLSKKIVDSDEYRKVRHSVFEFRSWIRQRALPAPTLRTGAFMIPIPLLETVEGKFSETQSVFNEHVDAFIAVYDILKADAKKRLGEMYDEADYPAPAALRKAFGIERAYIELDAPGRLKSVNEALFQKAREEWNVRFQKASENAVALIRAEMKGMVDKMVEQLGNSEDGKKKSFHAKSVEKFSSFLENFELRNVHDDGELAKLTDAASRLLSGVDVKSIRKDEAYRTSVRSTFEAIQGKLERLVIDKPTRAISFEEE